MNIICCVVMSVSILSITCTCPNMELTYVDAVVMQHTNIIQAQIL